MGSNGLTILCVMFVFLCVSVYFSTRFLLMEDDCSDTTVKAHPSSGRLESLSDEEFTARYLSSSSYQFAKQKGVGVQRMKILIAVITTEKYLLSRAQVIYKTWGQNVGSNNKLYFFVGEHSNTSHPDLKHLPIVKMKGLRDDVYPPMEKVFGILEYFYSEYGEHFRWFVRADDDVYIRIDKLEAMLDGLSWTEKRYMGLPGHGVESYRKVLKLLPKESYCMGGPSIILSAAGLEALYPYLRKCLNAALSYNQRAPKDMGWYYDDVELGRCASRTLGMSCSRGSKSKHELVPFFNDYKSEALDSRSLWEMEIFREVVTIHPVKKEENMYKIHHFYRSLKLMSLESDIQFSLLKQQVLSRYNSRSGIS